MLKGLFDRGFLGMIMSPVAAYMAAMGMAMELPIRPGAVPFWEFLYLGILLWLVFFPEIDEGFYVLLFRKKPGFPKFYSDIPEGEARDIASQAIRTTKRIVLITMVAILAVLAFLGAPWVKGMPLVFLSMTAAGIFAGAFFAISSLRKEVMVHTASKMIFGLGVIFLYIPFLRDMGPMIVFSVLHNFLLFDLIVGLVKIYAWGWEPQKEVYSQSELFPE